MHKKELEASESAIILTEEGLLLVAPTYQLCPQNQLMCSDGYQQSFSEREKPMSMRTITHVTEKNPQ